MNFHWKIFFSIFITALTSVLILSFSLLMSIQNGLEKEFVERYQNFGQVLGTTLRQTEASVEAFSINAAKYLKLVVEKEGVPSHEKLHQLVKELDVSQLVIADSNGRFVRDTVTSPEVHKKGLFDFCVGYKGLLTGETTVESTPIIPELLFLE